MGAQDFSTVGFGATAQAAYSHAVAEAEYEYGHDHYNGTISTTSGFCEFMLPQGIGADAFERLVWQIESAGGEPTRPGRLRPRAEEWERSQHAVRRKTWQAWERLSPGAREVVVRAARSIEKWGPAICVRYEPAAERKLKERRGLKGTQKQAYRFFGLAAS